jgi:hypothetical protein
VAKDGLDRRESPTTYGARVDQRPVAALAGLAILTTFAYVQVLTQGLFVFSEARTYLHDPSTFDPLRFLLVPYLDYGAGRLIGIGSFQLTGRVCGFDASCVQTVGAALTATAAGLLLVHTWQIIGSRLAAAAVVVLWVASTPVLGVALWQSTRFDMVAVVFAMVTSIVAWEVLGRPRLPRWAAVAYPVVTVALLAMAFNAKEWTYYLLGALPLIAVVRGRSFGGVQRNLLLVAVPVAYAVWFVGWALTHMSSAYAAHSGGASLIDGVVNLVRMALGLGLTYMGVWQEGADLRTLQGVAMAGYLAFAASLLVVMVISIRRTGLPRDLGPYLYLAAIGLVTLLVAARGRGSDAYYLTFTWWTMLALGALIVRRAACAWPRPRAAFAIIVGLFVIPAFASYVGHLVTPATAYRVLVAASAEMRDLGGTIRNLIDPAGVRSVWWRTSGDPPAAQYVLRGLAREGVGPELWPWLVDSSGRPAVEPLAEGVPDPAGPGDLIIETDRGYQAVRIVFEGRQIAPSDPWPAQR